MAKKERFPPPAVGGSSLLVIFAVLCLTVFALLSLSTVQADGRLSEAAVASVAAYYEADCRAEEILARLHISKNTLQKHLQNLYRKCGVCSRWDLRKLRP